MHNFFNYNVSKTDGAEMLQHLTARLLPSTNAMLDKLPLLLPPPKERMLLAPLLLLTTLLSPTTLLAGALLPLI